MIKKYTRYLMLALCLSIFPLTGGMTCPAKQQRVTYNSISIVVLGVNSAFAAYNDQVVKGTATYNVSVAKAYNDFQAGANVAINAAQMSSAGVAPQSLIDLANAVYAAIKQYGGKI